MALPFLIPNALSPVKWMRSSFLFLLAIALTAPTSAREAPSAIDSPYQVYTAKLRDTDLPYVFDGRQIRIVKVLQIHEANTAANKAACTTTWRAVDAYKQLCLNLADHRIFDVEVRQYPVSVFLQVPVLRIAKVSIGQHALVRMPDIVSPGMVKSLPAFLGTLADSDLRRAL